MDKTLLKNVEDWYSFTKSLCDMYGKLIELEQIDECGSEYKLIQDLFSKALEIEAKKFEKINFQPDNVIPIVESVVKNPVYADDVFQAYNTNFLDLRVMNRIGHYVINDRRDLRSLANLNYFLGDGKIKDYDVDVDSYLYTAEMLKRIRRNIIFMIDNTLKNVKDEMTREYLIYLKYVYIAISPEYESYYHLFHQKVLPFMDAKKAFPGYEDKPEKIETYLKRDFRNAILKDYEFISDVNDFIIGDCKRMLAYILMNIETLLVSPNDIDFIIDMENEIKKKLPISILKTQVRSSVESAFLDAKKMMLLLR